MNLYNAQRDRLLGKPSIESDFCPFCGKYLRIGDWFTGNRHHIIQKGMGGTKHEKDIPTVTVCGSGNMSGCHKRIHEGLIELDWDDDTNWWRYRMPKAMDSSWKPVEVRNYFDGI